MEQDDDLAGTFVVSAEDLSGHWPTIKDVRQSHEQCLQALHVSYGIAALGYQ
jgi:hypothetical protein